MNKLHWFYCEVFNQNIYFSTAKDLVTFSKQIDKALGVYLDPSDEFKTDALGTTFDLPGFGIFIWIQTGMKRESITKEDILVHEASHATTMIMKYRGIKCDETRSYLLGWIFKKCKAVL